MSGAGETGIAVLGEVSTRAWVITSADATSPAPGDFRATRASRGWVDRCPGCWAECEVVPNAIYTGDVLRAAIKN